VISNVAAPAANLTSTGATVTWTTDEPADSQVEYGTASGNYSNSSPLDETDVTSHSVTLSGLAASTTYYYRVKSRDPSGNLATSAEQTFHTWTLLPPLNIFIGVPDDDVEQRFNSSPAGQMAMGGGTLEFNADHLGFRFNSVPLPANARILAAYLQGTTKVTGSTSVTVRGERSANAAGFTSSNNNLTNRTQTNAVSGAWSVNITALNQTISSPSLKTIVEEIIGLSGWTSGNAMVFMIGGTGLSGMPGIYSYESANSEGNLNKRAVLHIEAEVP
jgi:hypothetical protein